MRKPAHTGYVPRQFRHRVRLNRIGRGSSPQARGSVQIRCDITSLVRGGLRSGREATPAPRLHEPARQRRRVASQQAHGRAARCKSAGLQPLDDGDVGHAAAFAHGLQPKAAAGLGQTIQQRGHQFGA